MLSVVVLAKNEEGEIGECLDTLKWAEELVVINDESTDKTLSIIENLKSKNSSYAEASEDKAKLNVFTRGLKGDFSGQRNFALRQVTTPSSIRGAQGNWILFVDADERVTPELRAEIQSTISKACLCKINHGSLTINGFYLKREDTIFGRKLKHGETANVKLLRLGRKSAGKWEGKVHETWKIMGKVGELENPLEHYPHKTISDFLEKINDYSTLRARELFDNEITTNLFEIIAYPTGKFFQNYLLRLGFLDKMPGFIVAILMSFHSFLVRSKLYLLWKQERYPKSKSQ